MDVRSGYPFWTVRSGLLADFPSLQQDRRCEVAIVGAGISGALIAEELASHGHEVLLLDEGPPGWGSTAASTALIQYEIDTHLTDLARLHGEAAAVLAYRACAAAVLRLGEIAGAFRDVGWQRCDSVYYAGRPGHAARLAQEFALRKRHGFDVEWLDAARLRERLGFSAAAAIVNRPAAALDPYRLTCRLLQRLRRNGSEIHERSAVDAIEVGRREVRLQLRNGVVVRAARVVVAAGYASQRWLRERVARNHSSYAFVSEPIAAAALGPLRNTLLWESSRPYLYLRSTRDGRLIVGGEDDALDLPARRDRRVPHKAARLLARAHALFPQLPLQPAFCWGGTFAETRDGLPWFGPHPQYGPRVLFALAYGGNGITFSVLGAELLRALIERRAHPLRTLFAFGRKHG